jgi:hypothetical protein
MSEAEKRRAVWELEWKLAKGEGTPDEQREWAQRLIELRGVR